MLFRFGLFAFDSGRRQLLRGGEDVHLSPKAFALLKLLIEARPSAVSKTEIHRGLWPDIFVSEGNIPVLVAEIRATLGDAARSPRFVRTVHRFGYAFCAETITGGATAPSNGSSSAWLVWEGGRAPLAQGENVLGRDPQCAAWFDSAGVSRRHARIRLYGTDALLEDLGSKNGTYLRDARVTSAAPLRDGDRIRVGPLLVTFLLSPEAASTDTQGRG